jgi:hypothetical protein
LTNDHNQHIFTRSIESDELLRVIHDFLNVLFCVQ